MCWLSDWIRLIHPMHWFQSLLRSSRRLKPQRNFWLASLQSANCFSRDSILLLAPTSSLYWRAIISSFTSSSFSALFSLSRKISAAYVALLRSARRPIFNASGEIPGFTVAGVTGSRTSCFFSCPVFGGDEGDDGGGSEFCSPFTSKSAGACRFDL